MTAKILIECARNVDKRLLARVCICEKTDWDVEKLLFKGRVEGFPGCKKEERKRKRKRRAGFEGI